MSAIKIVFVIMRRVCNNLGITGDIIGFPDQFKYNLYAFMLQYYRSNQQYFKTHGHR